MSRALGMNMVGHISSVGNTFLRVLVIKDSAYNKGTRLIVLVLTLGLCWERLALSENRSYSHRNESNRLQSPEADGCSLF